ncbi:MAG: OmpA family protein [Epsilonproteobacteria bacterium]|nr:OmpA family protein [Campylobacterota bacterium]
MKKSNRILLLGILVSILYILLCIYIHNRGVDKTDTVIKESIKDDISIESVQGVLDSKGIDTNSTKNKSSLDYKIDNGVITIAGNMPILDDDDTLKQTMMRFCSEDYCDRTIIFSADKEMPSWKNLAKDIIEFFYEDNLTNAYFSADEYNNISVGGELLTQKSKEKINQIIKSSGITNIVDNTHLKVVELVDTATPVIGEVKDKNITVDENITIENSNISNSDDDIDVAQEKIVELLANKKINFYRNRARITRKSRKVLNEIIAIVKDIPDIKIEVKGYTDASGKRAINKWISQERAKSVKNYLGSHGITPRDIKAIGFGEDDLLYPDKPYSPLNRRVEIEIKRK